MSVKLQNIVHRMIKFLTAQISKVKFPSFNLPYSDLKGWGWDGGGEVGAEDFHLKRREEKQSKEKEKKRKELEFPPNPIPQLILSSAVKHQPSLLCPFMQGIPQIFPNLPNFPASTHCLS